MVSTCAFLAPSPLRGAVAVNTFVLPDRVRAPTARAQSYPTPQPLRRSRSNLHLDWISSPSPETTTAVQHVSGQISRHAPRSSELSASESWEAEMDALRTNPRGASATSAVTTTPAPARTSAAGERVTLTNYQRSYFDRINRSWTSPSVSSTETVRNGDHSGRKSSTKQPVVTSTAGDRFTERMDRLARVASGEIAPKLDVALPPVYLEVSAPVSDVHTRWGRLAEHATDVSSTGSANVVDKAVSAFGSVDKGADETKMTAEHATSISSKGAAETKMTAAHATSSSSKGAAETEMTAEHATDISSTGSANVVDKAVSAFGSVDKGTDETKKTAEHATSISSMGSTTVVDKAVGEGAAETEMATQGTSSVPPPGPTASTSKSAVELWVETQRSKKVVQGISIADRLSGSVPPPGPTTANSKSAVEQWVETQRSMKATSQKSISGRTPSFSDILSVSSESLAEAKQLAEEKRKKNADAALARGLAARVEVVKSSSKAPTSSSSSPRYSLLPMAIAAAVGGEEGSEGKQALFSSTILLLFIMMCLFVGERVGHMEPFASITGLFM